MLAKEKPVIQDASETVYKLSEEVGIRYMNKWEEEDLIRHEAKEEGLAEGLAEGLNTHRNFYSVN